MPTTTLEEFRASFIGVCAVLVTPLRADGSLDIPSAERLADHVARSRASTITVGGSVAEFLALDTDERLDVLVATVATVRGRRPVIAATGGELRGAAREAAASVDAGATAIMVHQPLNPFRATAGWVAYHQALAGAVDPTPVVLYVRDAAVGAAALRELADACPNVVGIKYAVPDVLALARLTEQLGARFTWLCGLAEKWAPFAWQAGARGFTSGLVNLDDTVPMALLQALEAADLGGTRAAWARAAAFEDLRARRGGGASVGTVKTALTRLGVIADPTVRPPLDGLDAGEVAALDAVLAAGTLAAAV